MGKAGDYIVGGLMILGGLASQFIVIVIVFSAIWLGIAHYFEIEAQWMMWLFDGVMGLLLNGLLIFEFCRQRRARPALGVGGAMFLLPRGIYRIRFGRETYSDAETAVQGFPVLGRKSNDPLSK